MMKSPVIVSFVFLLSLIPTVQAEYVLEDKALEGSFITKSLFRNCYQGYKTAESLSSISAKDTIHFTIRNAEPVSQTMIKVEVPGRCYPEIAEMTLEFDVKSQRPGTEKETIRTKSFVVEGQSIGNAQKTIIWISLANSMGDLYKARGVKTERYGTITLALSDIDLAKKYGQAWRLIK